MRSEESSSAAYDEPLKKDSKSFEEPAASMHPDLAIVVSPTRRIVPRWPRTRREAG